MAVIKLGVSILLFWFGSGRYMIWDIVMREAIELKKDPFD